MILTVFWASVGLLLFTYVVFPVIVLLRGLLWHRPHRSGEETPSMTVVIAARNEAEVIAAKLDNLLKCDYPRDRLEILVASDGSDDGTNEIVSGYADQGVRLLPLARLGKTHALNAAAADACGDVLVFSDANSMFASEALKELARPLADSSVGGVAGDQRYASVAGAHDSTSGERRYWDFDRLMKKAQTRAGSTISATGAIYAVRRELFDPIPDGVTDDFYASTGVIAHGRRLVFVPDAAAFEAAAESSGAEFTRKVRVITQGLHAVRLRQALLNPRRHGFYAMQLLWHKVLRRLMVVPLLTTFAATPLLWRRGSLYKVAAVAQCGFYGAAAVGFARPDARGPRSQLIHLPAYVCLVNVACLRALANVARGRRIERWEPQRQREAPPTATNRDAVEA